MKMSKDPLCNMSILDMLEKMYGRYSYAVKEWVATVQWKKSLKCWDVWNGKTVFIRTELVIYVPGFFVPPLQRKVLWWYQGTVMGWHGNTMIIFICNKVTVLAKLKLICIKAFHTVLNPKLSSFKNHAYDFPPTILKRGLKVCLL